jgi:hypothetical protein
MVGVRATKHVSLLIALAFTVFVVVMVSSSLGGSGTETHVMPDGSTMEGSSMPE